MADSKLSSLMRKYKLNNDDCNKQVTGIHLEKISRSYSKRWMHLIPYLDMDTIVGSDLQYCPSSEDCKRLLFFQEWKSQKGTEATYEAIIRALLEIDCRNDAEEICKLLQQPMQPVTSENTSSPEPLPVIEGTGTI